MKNQKAEGRKQKAESQKTRKPESKKARAQTWCVWVKHALRYVNARTRDEARDRYVEILKKFPSDLAVLEYTRAKAMGLMET